MPTVATCLWFARDALAAAEFYVALLPGSTIDRVVRSPLDYPAGRAGDVLTADGGKEVQCGWLNDRWGVPWQIVPAVMNRLLADPDPARAGRAMAAMMTMIKLDGDAIAAAAG